jgi:hypothetical protein
MKLSKQPFSEMSLKQRLFSVALTWGVPVLLLDLVGAPRQYWMTIVMLALPGLLGGVLVYSLLEHMVLSRKKKT